MCFREDWEGIAQERLRSWDAEVRKYQVVAQLPRRRARWQRWAGAWLIGVGGSLTEWGKAMSECDMAGCESEPQLPAGI